MIKNRTRTSLALSAILAMGASLLTGLPASAAPQLFVAPNTGTLGGMISGEVFTVKVFANTEYTFTTGSDLRWEVSNPSGLAVTPTSASSAVLTYTDTAGTGTTTTGATSNTLITVVPTTKVTTSGGNVLSLVVPANVSGTLQVRAYIESGDATGLTAGDLASPAQVITYTTAASVIVTGTLTQPVVTDTTVRYAFSLSGINTEQLTASKLAVQYSNNVLGAPGTTGGATAPVVDVLATADRQVDGSFTSSATVTALASGNLVKAQLMYNAAGTATGFQLISTTVSAVASTVTVTNVVSAAGIAVGSPITVNAISGGTVISIAGNAITHSTLGVGNEGLEGDDVVTGTDALMGTAALLATSARTISSLAATAVNSANVKALSTATATEGTPTPAAATATARLNSAYAVKATVLSTGATPTAMANVSVAVTINTTAALSPSGTIKTITVNGVTYTANSSLPGQGSTATLQLLSNANGEVIINISSAGLVATEEIHVSYSAQNLTAAVHATQTAAAFSVIDFLDVANTNQRSTLKNATISLDYRVVDQWGVGAPDGSYRLAVTAPGTTAGTADDQAYFPLVVGGRAVFSATDLSGPEVTTGSYLVTAQLQLRGMDGNFASGSLASDTFTWNIVSVSSVGSVLTTGTSLTVTRGGSQPVAPATLLLTTADGYYSYDSRIDSLLAEPVQPAGYQVSVAGTVRANDVAQTPLAGVPVTISATGLLFRVGTVYGLGSLTVLSAADGSYSFDVFSRVAGDLTVTVTAGSASATTVLSYKALGSTGDTVTIVAPTAVMPGTTLTFVVTVRDSFGNPVETTGSADVVVLYEGPGFPIASPTETDANGQLTYRVLLGTSDTGTAKLTVTYRETGSTTPTANLITASATVQIGAVASQGVRGWTRFIFATNELKMYARDVVGQGKVQFFMNGREIAWIRAVDATDPKLNVMNDGMVRSVFVSNMIQGKNAFEIYVNGVRIERRIFTR